VLVGFAAETNDLAGNAVEKMRRKNLDAIVANDVIPARHRVRVRPQRGPRLLLRRDRARSRDGAKDAIASAVWRAVCRKFLPG